MPIKIDPVTKHSLKTQLQKHVDLNARFTVQSLTEAFQSAWRIASWKRDGTLERCDETVAINFATNFLRTLRRNRQVWTDGTGWPLKWRKGEPNSKQLADGARR